MTTPPVMPAGVGGVPGVGNGAGLAAPLAGVVAGVEGGTAPADEESAAAVEALIIFLRRFSSSCLKYTFQIFPPFLIDAQIKIHFFTH